MKALRKIKKMLKLLPNPIYRHALRFGVAAAVEHEQILRLHHFNTVVDIGANKGQFAVLSRRCFSEAKIISFEPLPNPSAQFTRIFEEDNNITLHQVAIAQEQGKSTIHLSKSEDSSSLLPIADLQNKLFPGTEEVDTLIIDTAPLEHFVKFHDIQGSALLKLDVQGFEINALEGCESLLSLFDIVYCECSFVELYTGQKLTSDVIAWLHQRGFILIGTYNMSYDGSGRSIQADFMFQNMAKLSD